MELLFDGLSLYLPTDGGYEDAHQRTEEVEEAVGQIDKCGYSEHGRLGHTAGVPMDEYGGDGSCVFCGATQEARFETLAAEGLFVHVGCQYDGYELVACGEVEEETRADGRGHETEAAVCHADDDLGDADNHTTGYHRGTEEHGAEDEPDGVEHSCHSTRRDEFVEGCVACLDGCRTVVGYCQSASY